MSGIVQKLKNLAKTVIETSRPHAKLFWKYAQVELAPPKPSEIGEAIRDGLTIVNEYYRRKKWKDLTVKETFINSLITIEILCWFYVGECIGKRHIVGYKIK